MDLNQLVEAAVAKALADYISTRGALDDAFLDKLAEKVAAKIVQAEKDIEKEIQRRTADAHRELMEHMKRMHDMDLYNQRSVPARPWDDPLGGKRWIK